MHRIYGAFRRSGAKRFIVLARARTGSNLLLSLLNSHPNIRAGGEILSRLEGRDYADVLATAYRREPNYIAAQGFKIFYYHPNDDGTGRCWDHLVGMSDLHIIHLKRRNVLRTLVSRKIAEVTGVWSSHASCRTDPTKPRQVTFTPDELSRGFEQTRQWEQKWDHMFRDHAVLPVYYEDLTSDIEGQFGRITDFLSVPPFKPHTVLRRQNPEGLRCLLSNYRELRTAFEGTQWLRLFDE